MKLAVIGTGFIVHEALMCLDDVPEIEVTSVFARAHSLDKAKDLSRQHNIPHIYTDYDQLLHQDVCDTVYIGLVNSAHFEYAQKALLKHKNVILEKPFCINSSQAKELIDLAADKHLFLFEAVRPLHVPNYRALKADLSKLGNIRCIQCNYSQYSSRYDSYKTGKVLPALDPACYGGALFDINIYNINFVVSLFGSPKKVEYKANMGFNGVDTSGTAILQYDDFYALCTGAKDSSSPGHALIQGDKGYISVDDGANLIGSYTLGLNKKEEEHKNYNVYTNWMKYEFVDFAKMLKNNEYQRMKAYLEISYQVMNVIDQAIRDIPYGIRKEQ